ncbi:histone acetyl transferase [Rhypophila sp. PSN 637]
MAPAKTDDEINWEEVEEKERELIEKLISNQGAPKESGLSGGNGITDALDRIHGGGAFDQSNKADDAIDFEDLSDDDLPDEEETQEAGNTGDLPGLTDDSGTNDLDDLFGGDVPSSPLGHDILPSSPRPLDADGDIDLDDQIHLGPAQDDENRALAFRRGLEGREEDGHEKEIPGEKKDPIQACKALWPHFEQGDNLYWLDFFKPRIAHWIGKKSIKPPKPLIPTKLSLEVDHDQEKLFKMPAPATNSVYQKIKDAEARGLVCLEEPEPLEQADLEVFDLEDESETETVGGFTLQDITTICDDWDSMIGHADVIDTPAPAAKPNKRQADELEEDDDAAWDEMFLDDEPPAKKRRTEPPRGLPPIPQFKAPNFDNFEQATQKLGKRVILDMNDPYLLIDNVESERATKRRKITHKIVRLANGKNGREVAQRFNFAMDAAYDALKENAQNRVRATLANIPIEHSLPAMRLAWPFFQVRLLDDDPYSYHRPTPNLKKEAFQPVTFVRPTILKRKNLKGKKVADIFKKASDLTLNDNSTAVLFEYCEEIPQILSNRGMGQKIINYYRRTKGSDVRPEKRELGENCVLMPEDRSPFAIFGQVNPGEVVPTLHNNMFRAPIFKHKPRDTDFILGRTSTGGKSSWFLRGIDHLYVVGQTMPSVDIPSPHSRRVTGMVKHRLKMISLRLIRKKGKCTLSEVTQHVYGTSESQNRQKLKEFLLYDKESKEWTVEKGMEHELEEKSIQEIIRPEDVCCLDAMQIGIRELENMGYEIKAMKEELDNENSETATNDVKMAPWHTTKAFIDASHGKAMLAVHGHGDPTGKGLGLSYIRTSMKGGYLEQLHGPLATSADAMAARKANGGHLYNVKTQDMLYTEAINNVWVRQRESLEDTTVHEDDDVAFQQDDDARFDAASSARPPVPTDNQSQVSRLKGNEQQGGNRKKLKITREITGPDGKPQTVTEIVHDPAVIATYTKTRRKLEEQSIDIYSVHELTDNAEKNRLILEIIDKEKERLERNRERTKKRDKQKKLQQQMKGGGGSNLNGMDGASGSPDEPSASVEKAEKTTATGTTRKCANCGMVGHIKTNKKLCPKLNGSMPRDPDGEDGLGAGSLGAINKPVAAGFTGVE